MRSTDRITSWYCIVFYSVISKNSAYYFRTSRGTSKKLCETDYVEHGDEINQL